MVRGILPVKIGTVDEKQNSQLWLMHNGPNDGLQCEKCDIFDIHHCGAGVVAKK